MSFGRTIAIAPLAIAGFAWMAPGTPALAQAAARADTLRFGGAFLASPARAPGGPESPAASASIAGPLVRTSDWILGTVFLGSFASTGLEGFDEVDDVIAPNPGRGDAVHRWAGRNYGRLEVISALSAATFLAGTAAGSETTARVGLRGLETLLLNAGLTTALKVGFGRSRPYTGFDEDRYRPLAWERDEWSFPSGHTSNVFAIATTLSLELGEEAPWVPFVVYPLAGWTGLSRILDEKHYFTDVVAGAAVGIFSARLVHRFHERADLPTYPGPGSGVTPRLLMSAGRELLVGVSLAFD